MGFFTNCENDMYLLEEEVYINSAELPGISNMNISLHMHKGSAPTHQAILKTTANITKWPHQTFDGPVTSDNTATALINVVRNMPVRFSKMA